MTVHAQAPRVKLAASQPSDQSWPPGFLTSAAVCLPAGAGRRWRSLASAPQLVFTLGDPKRHHCRSGEREKALQRCLKNPHGCPAPHTSQEPCEVGLVISTFRMRAHHGPTASRRPGRPGSRSHILWLLAPLPPGARGCHLDSASSFFCEASWGYEGPVARTPRMSCSLSYPRDLAGAWRVGGAYQRVLLNECALCQ